MTPRLSSPVDSVVDGFTPDLRGQETRLLVALPVKLSRNFRAAVEFVP